MVENFCSLVVSILVFTAVTVCCENIRYGKPFQLSAKMGIIQDKKKGEDKPDLIVTQQVSKDQKQTFKKYYFPVSVGPTFQSWDLNNNELTTGKADPYTAPSEVAKRKHHAESTRDPILEFEPDFSISPAEKRPYGYKPTNEPYNPARPTYKPTVKPYQPTDMPYKPTIKPYKPTNRPYKPTSKPYQSSEKPIVLFQDLNEVATTARPEQNYKPTFSPGIDVLAPPNDEYLDLIDHAIGPHDDSDFEVVDTNFLLIDPVTSGTQVLEVASTNANEKYDVGNLNYTIPNILTGALSTLNFSITDIGNLQLTLDEMAKWVNSLSNNSLLNGMIVFGLPLITAGLTAAGSGPVFIAAAAWLFPVALLFLFPPTRIIADVRQELV